MPTGILIDYRDGSPAMEITTSLRCPSFCGHINQINNTTSTTVPNYVAGSEAFFLPDEAAAYRPPQGTDIVGRITAVTGVSITGSAASVSLWHSDSRDNDAFPAGTFFQIFGTSSYPGNIGIYVSDSTDFSSITDASRIMSCAWYGDLQINGSANLPVSGGLAFIWFDNSNVSVCKVGNTLYARNANNDGYGDDPASVSVRLAIFTQSPPVAGSGINIFNSNGVCTFSTTKKPMVFGGFITPTGTFQGMGGKYMIPVGTHGYRASTAGGWCNMRVKGLVMSGNSVRVAPCLVRSRWADQYSINGDRNAIYKMPKIPFFY